MTLADARLTIRIALALRDSIRASSSWEMTLQELEARGVTLDEVRQRLAPRIACDPHNHTIHSDGQLTHRQLIWWCKAVGIEAIGVTDHDNIAADFAEGIREGERLGVRMIPGCEFTVHRLGGQAWKGLEVGMHFFPAARFADFIQSDEGKKFRQRFEKANQLKSEQAWATLENVNERLMVPRGLEPLTREALWLESGEVDPVCASTITVLMLAAFFQAGREDLLNEFPDTRVIWAYLNRNDFVPSIQSTPQTLDDLIAVREELAQHGIKSTLTLNHPEEWLSKCGLVREDGSPDEPAIRRLVGLLLLHDPVRLPFSFVELYSARNNPKSHQTFLNLFKEFQELRKNLFPNLGELHAIASTDSHRVSGYLDSTGEVQGWVAGEDFIYGIGMVDEEYPHGNLKIPDDYPTAEGVYRLMERCSL